MRSEGIWLRFLSGPDIEGLGARGTAFFNVTMLDAIFGFAVIRVTSRRPESREGVRGAAASRAIRAGQLRSPAGSLWTEAW